VFCLSEPLAQPISLTPATPANQLQWKYQIFI
jgi:hypothetical protein